MQTIIFETDEPTRQILRSVLTEGDNSVVCVDSMGALEEQIERNSFDICVIDLDQDTRRVIELIAKCQRTNPAFVAVCSTDSDEQKIAVRALECGARGFLEKPVSEQEIRLKLAKVIGERGRLVQSQHLLEDLILDRSDLRLKVAERERFLSNLIDAAPFAILTTDHEGRIVSTNRVAVELNGYAADELLGMPSGLLFETRNTQENAEVARRAVHVRKDGVRRPVFARSRRIVNEIGNHVADLHIVEDLADKARAEEQLIRAEQRSLLGQLAPQIGHEFKSPIQIIMGVADLLQQGVGEGEDREWLDRIIRAAEEMSHLVSQMMELGKPSPAEQTQIDLGPVVRDVLDTLDPIGVSKHLEVDLQISSPIPPSKGTLVKFGRSSKT
jgi:PAS domain S-box-containing protein